MGGFPASPPANLTPFVLVVLVDAGTGAFAADAPLPRESEPSVSERLLPERSLVCCRSEGRDEELRTEELRTEELEKRDKRDRRDWYDDWRSAPIPTCAVHSRRVVARPNGANMPFSLRISLVED